MSAVLTITRAGPLTTIQDAGRFGMLRHGISASGPMDRATYALAGALAGGGGGGVEFTLAGIELKVQAAECRVGFAGGQFVVRRNGEALDWPGHVALATGDTLAITPGAWGNYGYLRFDADIAVPSVMGSISSNSRARLGGQNGHALAAGDTIRLLGHSRRVELGNTPHHQTEGPIHVIWGLHADLFPQRLRNRFVEAEFKITSQMDRMGVRLADPDQVFADATNLSLVSDAIVPGDIQILGNGTPIVLMRDHQPTGGYPRIATVITADLDRFAQMRPGSSVAFQPVTVEHAHQLLRSQRP